MSGAGPMTAQKPQERSGGDPVLAQPPRGGGGNAHVPREPGAGPLSAPLWATVTKHGNVSWTWPQHHWDVLWGLVPSPSPGLSMES